MLNGTGLRADFGILHTRCKIRFCSTSAHPVRHKDDDALGGPAYDAGDFRSCLPCATGVRDWVRHPSRHWIMLFLIRGFRTRQAGRRRNGLPPSPVNDHGSGALARAVWTAKSGWTALLDRFTLRLARAVWTAKSNFD